MTPTIQTLFNCLSDGLAIIAPDGKVRFANEEMLALLPVRVGEALPHAAIAAVVDQALAGHVPLPHSFESEIVYAAEIAAPDRLAGHVVRSPAGKDLVLVLRNMTEASVYQTAIANLGTLVERSLREPLQRFAEDFDHLLEIAAPVAAALPADADGPARTLDAGYRLVRQVLDLVHLVQTDPV